MKPHHLVLAGLALAGAAALSLARDLFTENFDALDGGESIVGQGGWADNSKTGVATVAHSMPAWSPSNYLDLEAGGGVQHAFPTADFTDASLILSFYFKPDNDVATGHNLQLGLRKGSGGPFYLNIRGALDALDIGSAGATADKRPFLSPLRKGTWYFFAATFDHTTNRIAYSVTDATTHDSLLTGALDFNPGPVDRLVIGSTNSTTAGDWSIDSVSLATTP